MKRTLSLILALMMVVPFFAAIPVSAYDPEGTVYYSTDFAQRYADGGFTEAVDTDFFGIGITPINRNLTDKNVTTGNFYNNLTAEGLKFGTVKNRTAGVVLKQYDLTQHSSYVIDFDMSIDTPATNAYIYFGFGYNGSGTFNPFDKNTNIRYNGGGTLLLNGDYSNADADGAVTMWKKMLNEKAMVNYQFVVKENKLTNVIFTCGDLKLDFANYTDKALDASAGTFGFTWRSADDAANPQSVLKNFNVTVGEEKVYSVTFADVYTAKGLTKDTDALSLADLDLGVINKVYAGKTISDENKAKIKTQLTENGYYASNVSANTVGALINGFDLTSKDSYNLSLDMAVDIDVAAAADYKGAYLYFGYGYKADGGDHNTYESYTNFRYNGKYEDAYGLYAGKYTTTEAEKAAELWNKIVTEKAMVNYTFVVETNLLMKVIVTAGETSVVYTTKEPLNAALGNFGVTVRTGTAAAAPSMTLKKVEVTAHIPEGTRLPQSVLTPNRLVPTEGELKYEDTKTTKYKTGYVLHNMDFSKITDWDSTGYFVTNDADPVGFELIDGKLSVITPSDKATKIMLTGNEIPKNIQDFTVTIKYRYIEESPKYLCFIHGNTLDPVTGKTSSEKNTCFRWNGTVDNATPVLQADHDKVIASAQAGEWITVTCSAMFGEIISLKMECGGNVSELGKATNTKVPENSYKGILVGAGTNLEIASIQVVAGYVDDIEKLVWPGEEGALVQSVSADAVQEELPPVTEAPTLETPTEETPTEEIPATTPATTPVTKAPTTENKGDGKDEKSGCGASVAMSAVAVAMLFAAVPFVAKRRED